MDARTGLDEDEEVTDPSLLVFNLRLPFALPLREERLHVFPLRADFAHPSANEVFGPPMVRLRLMHVEIPPEQATPVFRSGFAEGLSATSGAAPNGEPTPPPSPRSEIQTWAELATQFAPLAHEDETELTTECFERCLEQMNHLLRGFRLVMRRQSIRPINKESLDPFVVLEFEGRDGERQAGQIFMLHDNYNGGYDFELVDEEEEDLVYTGMESLAHDHPFGRHREWLDRAVDAQSRRGDYEEALICLQVSVECLLSGLVSCAAVDEGLRATEVRKRVSEWTSPFAALIGTHLPAMLGGYWGTDGAGPVAIYWRDLYVPRNSMSHGGRRTTGAEVQSAFSAFDGLLDFTVDRLLRSPSRFPRTLLALLGEPGLKHHNHWTRRLRDFVDQVGHEPFPYWAPWDVVRRGGPSAESTGE